jgi:hypothetical protein
MTDQTTARASTGSLPFPSEEQMRSRGLDDVFLTGKEFLTGKDIEFRTPAGWGNPRRDNGA